MIAATVGAAQMHDRTYKNECAQKVKASQAKLAVALKQLHFLQWDSQTSFLLIRFDLQLSHKRHNVDTNLT